MTPWTTCAVTLFPEMFPGPLGASLAGQALAAGVWRLETVDIREFASDKHRSVDDTPFGGGPGMVLRPDVVDSALAAATALRPGLPVVFLTPRGRPLRQETVRRLSAGQGMIVLCGRYEGVDERAIDVWRPEEISLGDFVLSGGEPAALALIDACVRLLPGVVGEPASLTEESFERGLLEYPHYTRPRVWRDREVPDALLSGHHQGIRDWRRREAERLTRERRPDLWRRHRAGALMAEPDPAAETKESVR